MSIYNRNVHRLRRTFFLSKTSYNVKKQKNSLNGYLDSLPINPASGWQVSVISVRRVSRLQLGGYHVYNQACSVVKYNINSSHRILHIYLFFNSYYKAFLVWRQGTVVSSIWKVGFGAGKQPGVASLTTSVASPVVVASPYTTVASRYTHTIVVSFKVIMVTFYAVLASLMPWLCLLWHHLIQLCQSPNAVVALT